MPENALPAKIWRANTAIPEHRPMPDGGYVFSEIQVLLPHMHSNM
jgi:hypothetical protein